MSLSWHLVLLLWQWVCVANMIGAPMTHVTLHGNPQLNLRYKKTGHGLLGFADIL